MSDSRPHSPDFEFCDDGGRPKVTAYVTISKYAPGDKVYMVNGTAREGPYLIETVPYAGKYTLCFENGKSAKDGVVISEDTLVAD